MVQQNSTQGLTLETLPKAFSELSNDVSEIKRLLLEKHSASQPDPDRWFDVLELCEYLRISKQTAYDKVHKREIPCNKQGKKLRFLKSEIDAWIKSGRKKTLAEIASEADTFLKNKNGGKQ
jgi:excisionase family DNA binding protein